MPEVWTIKGQAGKAVDATARMLAAMQAEGCLADFASLADDTLTWDIWLDQVADGTGLVPEIGQIISLWRDSTRFFQGHVTARAPRFSAGRMGYSITVSGPWYFLRNTSISAIYAQIIDDVEVFSERAMFLFEEGTPTNHLISLVSRAVEVGLPISLGSIADTFTVPRLSLREMSFADAISDVMRWVADGLVYFDHSASSGYPALCMQRRDDATTITLNPTLLAISDLSIQPRYDLKIGRVDVQYANRITNNTTTPTAAQLLADPDLTENPNKGLRDTAYATLQSGIESGQLPSRQIYTVTGPEISTVLPVDPTDSVRLTSSPINTGTVHRALEIHHDLLNKSGARVSVYTNQRTDTFNGATTMWPDAPLLAITDNEGNDIDLTLWPFFLEKGEIRDWFKKDGIEAINARITATVASSLELIISAPAPDTPKWATVLGAKVSSHFTTGGGGLMMVRYVWQATVSCSVPLVKQLYRDAKLTRQEDWGWRNPPITLAADLLATQNWLPYEGIIPCAVDEIPAGNSVGSVLNVSNWLSETAAMNALVSGYSARPATGEIVFRLGPPARHAYLDLMNRFRQNGVDNIYWLDAAEPPTPSVIPTAPAAHVSGEGPTTFVSNTITLADGSTTTITTEISSAEVNEDGITFPVDEDYTP